MGIVDLLEGIVRRPSSLGARGNQVAAPALELPPPLASRILAVLALLDQLDFLRRAPFALVPHVTRLFMMSPRMNPLAADLRVAQRMARFAVVRVELQDQEQMCFARFVKTVLTAPLGKLPLRLGCVRSFANPPFIFGLRGVRPPPLADLAGFERDGAAAIERDDVRRRCILGDRKSVV